MTRELLPETIQFSASLGQKAWVVHADVLLRFAKVCVGLEKVAVATLQDVDLGKWQLG